jgi:uncharacterized SAM-binding protein YcdF (DUF218 family)
VDLSPVPPPVTRPGGRFRRIAAVALLVVIAAAAYAFVNVGRWLAPQQPLQKADAIFVLAGTVAERPLEAADLYEAGYAPRILVTRDTPELAVLVAGSRGAPLPQRFELNREMLLKLGVPDSALIVPDRIHDNTASEAETLRAVAVKMRWKRVIVVSSTYHLRRVAIACRRQLRGTGIELVLRATRYDPAIPDRWWTRRNDIRWVISEVPKVLAYSVRLGA